MNDRARFEREAIPELEHLLAFASKLCRSRQGAADLAQETMLKAYRYFHTYRTGSNCRAWLFQICKNTYINTYRRRHYEPVAMDVRDLTDGDTDGRTPTGVTAWDEEDLMRHEGWLGDEVASALEALPQDYQTALILSDLEGHTYEEIATFMSTPVGTIRSRIHRGRRMLADVLHPYAVSKGWCLAEASADR